MENNILKNKDKNVIENKDAQKKTKNSFIILVYIVMPFLLTMILLQFIRPAIVNGVSMNNTLKDGDYLLINTLIYRKFENIKYKDIVVIKTDKFVNIDYLIKRVIAVSGDKLVIKNNKVYVNGNLLNEDYIKEPMDTNDIDITIPEGKIFVMGDNRNNSLDSRSLSVGLIDKNDVVGKSMIDLNKLVR